MDRPIVIVTLNAAEQRIARWIGEQRNRANEHHNVTEQKRTDASAVSIHVDGFGAELAFCKLHNVYPDFTINPQRGGHDCELLDARVDVKCSRHEGARLYLMPAKVRDADCYALMIGTLASGRYRFAGLVNRADVARFPVEDLGHGPTIVVEQDALDASAPLTAADIFGPDR